MSELSPERLRALRQVPGHRPVTAFLLGGRGQHDWTLCHSASGQEVCPSDLQMMRWVTRSDLLTLPIKMGRRRSQEGPIFDPNV